MGFSKSAARAKRRRRGAGFTLIEVLLALFMFSIIVGVIFASFAAVASGIEKGRQSADLYRIGRAAVQYIVQEINAAWYDKADRDTMMRGKRGASGQGRDHLEFTLIPYRRFAENVPGYELCRVSYSLEANQDGQTPLIREENCFREDERRTHSTTLVLTDLAVAFEVTYYDAAGSHDEWPLVGAQEEPLPCQVRVALTLRDANKRERTFITTAAPPMRAKCEDNRTGRP